MAEKDPIPRNPFLHHGNFFSQQHAGLCMSQLTKSNTSNYSSGFLANWRQTELGIGDHCICELQAKGIISLADPRGLHHRLTLWVSELDRSLSSQLCALPTGIVKHSTRKGRQRYNIIADCSHRHKWYSSENM